MDVAMQTHGGYLITGDPRFPAQKRIKPEGKGSVPHELAGMYTSFQEAKNAIDHRSQRLIKEKEAKAEKVRAKRKRLHMEEPDAPEADTTIRDESVLQGTDNGGESS